MTEHEQETEKQERAEDLKGEIHERFTELAEINGPEDTLYFAHSIVSQMREELAALGDDGD
jgi:hypothetical protein